MNDQTTYAYIEVEFGKKDLVNLTKSVGWKVLEGYLAAQVTDLFLRLENADTIEEVKHIQGQLAGIKLALMSPETILNDLKYDEEEKKLEEEQQTKED